VGLDAFRDQRGGFGFHPNTPKAGVSGSHCPAKGQKPIAPSKIENQKSKIANGVWG
jgi:hypothetical protein